MKLQEHPDYIVNPDDLVTNFWGRTYLVKLTAQGISFLVNASDEEAACDWVMDFCVAEDLKGLYDPQGNEYLTAGNCGYSFTTHNIRMEEI